jgi:hypothetical protein
MVSRRMTEKAPGWPQNRRSPFEPMSSGGKNFNASAVAVRGVWPFSCFVDNVWKTFSS